jgi:hypothetical protein
MSVLTALWQAIHRSGHVWRCCLLVYVWNLALAACLGAIVYGTLDRSLGSSLSAGRMRHGFDSMWFDSFNASAAIGPAATFTPSVSGAGAVLDAFDDFLDGFRKLFRSGFQTGLVPVALVYLVSWSFFAGGFIGTFAETGPPAGFLHQARRHFPSFLIISLAGLTFYASVLGPARGWLDGLAASSLHDTIDERIRFGWTVAEYGGLWLVLALGNLVFDYVKVAVVHHGGAGPIWTVLAPAAHALRLVWRHPLKISGLYLGTAVIGVAGAVTYAAAAPRAGVSSVGGVLAAFLFGQAYIFSRVFLRSVFYAGETALYAALVIVDSGSHGPTVFAPAGRSGPACAAR